MDGVVRVGVATNDIFEASRPKTKHYVTLYVEAQNALGLVVGSAPWHQALRGAPCAFSVVGRAGS